MAGYTTRNIGVVFAKFKKTHFRITIPINGCSSFIDCNAWRHESESVKTMYLDATEYFISSRALMFAQISAVKCPRTRNLTCLEF